MVSLVTNCGMHAGRGRNKVRFDKFPQGGNESAPGEVFLWGHRADRKPAVQLSPRKPQLRGAFALQAKSLAYGRRRFDRAMAWAFNKKCNGRATRSKPCCSWDGRTAGDARRIMMLPGAAARAPIKKDSDIRPRGMATKVRTPFRQTSNATLEAAFAFRRQPVTVARGNELTNDRHTTGAISFFCPVGDAERHDVRSGHPINSFAFAPVGGTVGDH